jgi:hypothetical protein
MDQQGPAAEGILMQASATPCKLDERSKESVEGTDLNSE